MREMRREPEVPEAQNSNIISIVLILFKYCFHYCSKNVIFSNTVCITVSKTVLLLFGSFENTVLLLLVIFF